MKLSEIIKADAKRCEIADLSLKSIIKLWFRNSTFRFLVFFRLANNAYHRDKKLTYTFLKIIYKLRLVGHHQSEIPFTIKCGPGLYIGHFTSIVINPLAVIGKNVNLHKGVTIGAQPRGKRRGVPQIGDEVWIGINAVLTGNIKIGNNVLIAPNALVNFDVPDNSIVVGNPATIKPDDNATYMYVINKC